MERPRIAIVGAGVMGGRHISAISESKCAELAAIVDIDRRALESQAGAGVSCFRELDRMLLEIQPDGVIIATPTDRHVAPALRVIESGCAILIEKPIAATVSEAKQIATAAKTRQVQVLIGHHRRYYPQVLTARGIVRGKSLGELVLVSGQWGVRKHDHYYSPEWRRKRIAGPVLVNLSHEIDMLRFVCGDMTSVYAEIANQLNGWEKEDAAAITLRFDSGALGSFVLSDRTNSPWAWEFATGENTKCPRSSQNTVRFIGTKASLDFPNLVIWKHKASDGNWHEVISPTPIEEPEIDPFVCQIDHFCDIIRGRCTPCITVEDGTASLAATLAVFESADSGNRVSL